MAPRLQFALAVVAALLTAAFNGISGPWVP